jgi:2-keto-4-pentenoate hydratase/2-oxohepta-3-ene-1,7-dioic acid hydratase in catechol pathway
VEFAILWSTPREGYTIAARRLSLTVLYPRQVELAIVIGKGGKDIKEADALQHVLGYTVRHGEMEQAG